MTYVTGQPIIFVGCGQVSYKIATRTYYLVTDVPFNRLIPTFVSYGYRMLCKHSWVISVTSRFIELCYFFPLDHVIYTLNTSVFNNLLICTSVRTEGFEREQIYTKLLTACVRNRVEATRSWLTSEKGRSQWASTTHSFCISGCWHSTTTRIFPLPHQIKRRDLRSR